MLKYVFFLLDVPYHKFRKHLVIIQSSFFQLVKYLSFQFDIK